MNMRYSIRSLLVLTFSSAIVIVLFTQFNPWYDDSAFIRGCVNYKGKTIVEFVEFADLKNREVVKTVNFNNDRLLGLAVHARDGQFVYMYVAKHDQLKSTTANWDESFFNSCKITSVETYRIKSYRGNGFTLEPTQVVLPQAGK